MMDLNVFMFTQIGERQNELVLSSMDIDKAYLTDFVYSFYDELTDKVSFFRCFKMERHIIAAYYWKTDVPEPGSNRQGLYVVIGFVLTNIPSNIESATDNFVFYSTNFFRILEDIFNISLLPNVSDELYNILQTTTDATMNNVRERFISLKATLPKTLNKRTLFNQKINSQKDKSVLKYIYMLNDTPSFYDNWMVFCKEAFSLLSDKYVWDVSTLYSFTPQSLVIFENGSKISSKIVRSEILQYQNCKYILMI